jgi:hypothetical protein
MRALLRSYWSDSYLWARVGEATFEVVSCGATAQCEEGTRNRFALLDVGHDWEVSARLARAHDFSSPYQPRNMTIDAMGDASP